MMRIDNLQYANWSEKIFRQMREGNVDAVHVTIAYHETFRETVLNFEQWNRWFELYPDMIMKGQWASDVDEARKTDRTAIFFGFQDQPCVVDVTAGTLFCFCCLTFVHQSMLFAVLVPNQNK